MPDAGPIEPPETPPVQSPPSVSASYTTYLQATSAAYDEYQSSLTSARLIHQDVFSAADAALNQAIEAAAYIAATEYETLLDATNIATESVMTTAVSRYDTAYDDFSATWDAADGDATLQQAAVDQYNTVASVIYNETNAELDTVLAGANVQADAISQTLLASLENATDIWNDSTEAARAAVALVNDAAWNTFVSAEATAWAEYQNLNPTPPGFPYNPNDPLFPTNYPPQGSPVGVVPPQQPVLPPGQDPSLPRVDVSKLPGYLPGMANYPGIDVVNKPKIEIEVGADGKVKVKYKPVEIKSRYLPGFTGIPSVGIPFDPGYVPPKPLFGYPFFGFELRYVPE